MQASSLQQGGLAVHVKQLPPPLLLVVVVV